MTSFSRLSLMFSVLIATPALAEPAPATGRVVVRTADLDLASVSGQRLLERRLGSAVVEACGAASRVDLAGSNAVRRCRDDTRARIAADRERLVDLASRSGSIVIAAR